MAQGYRITLRCSTCGTVSVLLTPDFQGEFTQPFSEYCEQDDSETFHEIVEMLPVSDNELQAEISQQLTDLGWRRAE